MPKIPVLLPATEENTSKVYPSSEGVAALKNNNTGRDDILVEQLTHLGLKAHKWLLTSGCSQVAAHKWLLTSGCSQVAAHKWLLTSGCSQVAAHKWLLTMLNICFMENKIPTVWRQSKIIAILKPGNDSLIPMNYRPVSLLCHTYKLYERIILNRIAPAIEQHLIKEQTGFRSGKSCTSKILTLTQHIEDGYE